MRPRLLDAFSGAGGCAVGYHRAGFDVVGVDIKSQPRYPFEHHVGDALEFIEAHGREFDAIHASPPCQAYSRMRHMHPVSSRSTVTLLEPTWRLLESLGVPWVIENVQDAPMPHSTVLCGWTLGLPLYRHRRFGSSQIIMSPRHVRHQTVILSGHANLAKRYQQGGGREATGVFPGHSSVEAMGIDWMNAAELSQAIPPAYTEHIGRQLLASMRAAA